MGTSRWGYTLGRTCPPALGLSPSTPRANSSRPTFNPVPRARKLGRARSRNETCRRLQGHRHRLPRVRPRSHTVLPHSCHLSDSIQHAPGHNSRRLLKDAVRPRRRCGSSTSSLRPRQGVLDCWDVSRGRRPLRGLAPGYYLAGFQPEHRAGLQTGPPLRTTGFRLGRARSRNETCRRLQGHRHRLPRVRPRSHTVLPHSCHIPDSWRLNRYSPLERGGSGEGGARAEGGLG